MREVSLQLRHKTLAGLEWGDKSKPLILALHGWLDNAASFIPLAPYFKDYQLLAIDLPGHGLSEHRSPDAHYHLVDWVQDIHELLSLLPEQEVILLGHSMGGIVSSLYASSFPEKVKAFISIEAAGPLVEEASSSPEQLRKSVLSRIAIGDKQARHPQDLEQAIQARLMAGAMLPESAELLVKRNILETNQGLEWRSDRRLRTISSLRMTQDQAEAFLSSIHCPVLLIHGDEGFEKIKRNLNLRKDWLKKLEIKQVEGRHHLHMDNPGQTFDCIQSFLSGVFHQSE